MNLKNRFPEEVHEWWEGWPSCTLCRENSWDSLHHIVSPSSMHYIDGEHNRSIYNSAPVCNFKCHIGNGELAKRKTINELLVKTFKILDVRGYEPSKIDYKFIKTYKELYG